MRGDIELMGGPRSPPTRENPDCIGFFYTKIGHIFDNTKTNNAISSVHIIWIIT